MKATSLILFLTAFNLLVADIEEFIKLGDHEKAIEKLLKFDIAPLTETEKLRYYLFLGDVYNLSENYVESIQSLNKGLALSASKDTPSLSCDIYSELSKVSRKIHKYSDSRKYGRKALNIAQTLGDSSLLFKCNTILGNAFYAEDKIDSSITYFKQASKYVGEDLLWKSILQNNIANAAVLKGDYESALYGFEEVHKNYLQLSETKRANVALINMASASTHLGKFKIAKKQLEIAEQTARNFNWRRHLLLVFNLRHLLETSSNGVSHIQDIIDSISSYQHIFKNKEIAELEEKYQNDRLQNENEVITLQSQKRQTVILSLIGGLILLSGAAFFIIYNLRLKSRLKLANEENNRQLALQSQRSRMSQDLHDEMGSGLTSIKYISNSIQETNDIKKVKAIETTSNNLIHSMRDLLWSLDESKDNLGTLLSKIRETCNQFLQSSNMDYQIIESIDKSIPISGIKRRNIILILKESLTNILKHAEASKVEVQLESDDKFLKIQIKDNGKGFNVKEISSSGYGLNSIDKRIAELKGSFDLDSNEEGSSLAFEIPIVNEPVN